MHVDLARTSKEMHMDPDVLVCPILVITYDSSNDAVMMWWMMLWIYHVIS
jgi:hypothetical protein